MASFAELDPAEVELEVRVEDMDADDLVRYFVLQQKMVNGVEVTVRRKIDPNIFSRFIDDYPQPRAGRIVKWLFWKHGGKYTWSGHKQVVAISQFSSGWRWMAEAWWTQVQMHVSREERRLAEPKSRMVSITDL